MISEEGSPQLWYLITGSDLKPYYPCYYENCLAFSHKAGRWPTDAEKEIYRRCGVWMQELEVSEANPPGSPISESQT